MIELPWPPKALSPNFRSRSHWPRTRALADAKRWAYFAARDAEEPSPPCTGPVRLLLTFRPPTAHTRDRDNLLASCKAYLDGIAKYWGCDDSIFDPRVEIAEPIKGGAVIVTVEGV